MLSSEKNRLIILAANIFIVNIVYPLTPLQ